MPGATAEQQSGRDAVVIAKIGDALGTHIYLCDA
jgi:hypothetical protein